MSLWSSETDRLLRQILRELQKINRPRPYEVRITFQGGNGLMAKQIHVGEATTAVVTVFDQNGQPMPGFDFVANPPTWEFSEPASLSMSPGPQPNEENCAGVAPTTEGGGTILVHVPGVANGTAGEIIQVISAVPVPTSVAISFQ